jgi:hypothetical protein
MNNKSGHTCTFDQLQSYVDGTLDKALAGQLEQHLASCSECRTNIAKLRALEARTAQALITEAPEKYFDTFASRVSSRIAARKEAAHSKRVWFGWWGLVPAAAAAALVLLFTLNPEHSLRQQVREVSKTVPAVVAPSAERTAAPSIPRPAAPGQDDKLSLRKEQQAPPAAGMAIATKDEAAAPALRAGKAAAPQSVPAPETSTGGMAELKSKARPASGALKPETAPACAPLSINQLQVIVIHLPGGNAACPQPEIGAAIEIVLPADCPVAN